MVRARNGSILEVAKTARGKRKRVKKRGVMVLPKPRKKKKKKQKSVISWGGGPNRPMERGGLGWAMKNSSPNWKTP